MEIFEWVKVGIAVILAVAVVIAVLDVRPWLCVRVDVARCTEKET